MGQYDLERDTARKAARIAGRLCLAVRESTGGSAAMEKAGREPVTIADFGAQAAILSALAAQFPGDATLAEESAADFNRLSSNAQREQVQRHLGDALGRGVSLDEVRRWLDFGHGVESNRVWMIDPIDGTKGFIRGDQFAVAIGLAVGGELVVGALACPLLPFEADRDAQRGVILSAARGEGAAIEPLAGGPARPARVSGQTAIAQARAVESVEAGHSDHSFAEGVYRRAGVGGEPVRMDSQAKYAAVADGRAEIYLRHSPTPDYKAKVWDHAAGVLIVQEAGGQVSDLDGRPLDFSTGARMTANNGVLATNGPLHELILAAMGSKA
jgi:HAL2 family 3'(2'),5'-bisphosphate nucleotidase